MKDSSGERIAGAVRRTLGGELPLEEGLAMRLLERLAGEATLLHPPPVIPAACPRG